MEDHEAARVYPSCGLVEAERWWSGASSVSSGGTAMAEKQVCVPCSAWWKERGGMGEVGVGSATRGAAVEEGPGRRLRPGHGGHEQRAMAHVVSRGMSERERERTSGPAAKFIKFQNNSNLFKLGSMQSQSF
jgi:hypothetical protein